MFPSTLLSILPAQAGILIIERYTHSCMIIYPLRQIYESEQKTFKTPVFPR